MKKEDKTLETALFDFIEKTIETQQVNKRKFPKKMIETHLKKKKTKGKMIKNFG